jgi:hypothetical protein
VLYEEITGHEIGHSYAWWRAEYLHQEGPAARYALERMKDYVSCSTETELVPVEWGAKDVAANLMWHAGRIGTGTARFCKKYPWTVLIMLACLWILIPVLVDMWG